MTINEAITTVDDLKPNGYSQSQKIQWLSSLDGLIKRQIIDTHEGGEDVVFNGYDDDTPIDTELLIYEPYTDAYIYWLEAKIDLSNREWASYNNSITKHNEVAEDFYRDYNRTHTPKGKIIRFW